MNASLAPIGLFDSGIGGTSIWREIVSMLPHEDTLYLSDSKHAPYGNKSKEAIIDLSIKNTEFLLNQNCKIIVVACNTATTNAIGYLREKYAVPFIGIEPAIKPASLQSKTKKIGILATKGTLNSALFEKTSRKLSQDILIKEAIGEGLVELIEAGQMDSQETSELLKKYLNPMVEFGIDNLVLGCSHYPYLITQIRAIIGDQIQIIDSGFAVARQTKAVLNQKSLLNSTQSIGQHQFYSNAPSDTLQSILQLQKTANTSVKEIDF